jgi:uncharacterized protein (DUF1800 family)
MIALVLAAALTTPQYAEHALNRLAFGPRPGEVERVAKMGVDRWIEQQLHPESITDRKFPERGAAAPAASRRAPRPAADRPAGQAARPQAGEAPAPHRPVADLSAERILRAAHSERQLNAVMVAFWMNHFNVFAGKPRTRELIASYERDTIRPRIWGSFEELLVATAKSPAMLVYLDNARNRPGRINENYGRELMELHTLGVDGGYTQKDVTELARALVMVRRFEYSDAGERAIRSLARHPSTAKHIARKLAQRLVADEPPQSLVERVAKRFRETNGNLRETVRAVVTSPEFKDPKYFRAKVKTPFEYAISAVRAAGGSVENALPIARELRKIGEPLYLAQPPTGYSDTADAWQGDGALMARLEFATALAKNKMPGTRVPANDAQALARKLAAPEFQKQ